MYKIQYLIKQHYERDKNVEAGKITTSAGVIVCEAALKGKTLIFDKNEKFLKDV